MGFLGILEDKNLAHVPGTVILDEQNAHSEEVTAGLKHATGKNSHIVLVPQPSEDPNDPLNYSATKKLIILLILGYGACLNAATLGPLTNASVVVIAEDFKTSITAITLTSGYLLLVVGASAPLVSAGSRKIGKRPVFLLSSLLGMVGTIVGSATNNYVGFRAARIIQGLSSSAYESIIVAAIVQFILGSVSNFSSVITGPITNDLGWKWLFHLFILFSGIQIILLVLFVPETTYRRDIRYETDELVVDNLEDLARVEHRHGVVNEQGTNDDTLKKTETTNTVDSAWTPPPPKKTFVQEMAVFTGIHSDENIIQLFIAPFAVCLNLAVLWIVVISGMFTALYVAVAYDLAQIFSLPPYNLTAAGVGYLSLGPFIGGIIASVLLGIMYDPLIKWCTHRNHGIYEPEYRILPSIFGLATGVGLMAFGKLASEHKSYYATATMHGMMLFGIMFVAITTATYALDAYRDMSNEIFIAGMMLKNFVFYGFSYFVNNWTATAGPAHVFYVFGGVAFALMATMPPMFFFGKRYRSFWHRHNLLKTLKIRTHSEI
ncbi:hypothetical protein LTS15_002575 [Exophiala xenobiotica]|nr:hypothetical protein LTS15_002575 [Exophiala xenobiotica]